LPGACPGVAGTNYTHSPQKSLNLALLIDQHLYPIQMTFFCEVALLWPSLDCRQGQIDDPPASHTPLVNGAAIPALVHCMIRFRCHDVVGPSSGAKPALDSGARPSGDGEKAENRRPARLGIVSDPDLDQTASGRAYVLSVSYYKEAFRRFGYCHRRRENRRASHASR
jgi:hypothetical protein